MKEVIILGMGKTANQCPFDAPVWAINNAYKWAAGKFKDVNLKRILIAHRQVWDNEGTPIFNWHDIRELSRRGVEIWSTVELDVETHLIPWREFVIKYRCDYFSNVLCYAIAMAMDVDRIRLYGCDMANDREYIIERGSVEYWIGYARGKGIDVQIAEGGSLLRTVDGVPYGELGTERKPEARKVSLDKPAFERLVRKSNPDRAEMTTLPVELP